MQDTNASPAPDSAQAESNVSWTVYLNPNEGGHTLSSFGSGQRNLSVEYVPGSPGLAKANAVFAGKSYPPTIPPLIEPLKPGSNQFSVTGGHSGAGLGWTYGDGKSARFSWNYNALSQCSNGWAIVDEIVSPTSAKIQIGCAPGGATWVFYPSVTIIRDTRATITLYADGVSQGPVVSGQQMTVKGATISLEVEITFPTPAEDGLTIQYSLQQQ